MLLKSMFPAKTEMGIFLDVHGNIIEFRKVIFVKLAILLNFPKELTDIQSENKFNADTGEINLRVITIRVVCIQVYLSL